MQIRPKIVYVTVDKKHNTRLASKDKALQIGKSKNLPSGVVVDKEIVGGKENRFDFYLQSSQGIQG